MDIPLILSSLSSAADLVGMLVNERDRQKLAAIQIDLTNKITEAQAQLTQVLNTVIDQQRLIPILEQRIRELEATRAEKAHYQLTKVGTLGHFFAYQLRPLAELDERQREVAHLLCQPCFEVDKKVVLTGNGSGYWSCPACKHGANTEQADLSYTIPLRSRFDDY